MSDDTKPVLEQTEEGWVLARDGFEHPLPPDWTYLETRVGPDGTVTILSGTEAAPEPIPPVDPGPDAERPGSPIDLPGRPDVGRPPKRKD